MTAPNQEFVEDESQMETEEDLGILNQDSFSQAVVSGNDWTTETIINQINKGNIQLNPNFQRRDAWDKERKSRFIESLILGLPVPQIVLAESRERRGAYIVLDGKQRLLSIRQFAAKKNDLIFDQLLLSSLEIRKDLNKKSLEDMRTDLTLFDDLSAFENQPIRTVVIKNWPNETFLYRVFLRLNTGSVPLSPQELRQALHPGPFVSFLDEASSNSIALQQILKLKKPDFRMRDAELLLRHLAFNNFLSDYTGTLKMFLDEACMRLNTDWLNCMGQIEMQLAEFEQAHQTVRDIFKENSYKKWNGNGYENRFNRSIFDVMTYTFAKQGVRNLSKGREAEIEKAFINLCDTEKRFKSAIESTTKSLGATHARLSLWTETLNGVLNANIHVPMLVNNRIV